MLSRFPGQNLQKLIRTDMPVISGHYLCYVTPQEYVEAWDAWPIAEMKVFFFDHGDKRWGAGYNILGWVGPLPVMSLDELACRTPQEAGIILYFIGNEEDALIFKFDSGPYYKFITASLQPGKEGQCIYRLNSRKTKPEISAIWNIDTKKWEDSPLLLAERKRKQSDNASKTSKPPEKGSPPWELSDYVVGTTKQIATKMYHKQCEEYQDAFGTYLDMKKGYYIWELKRKHYIPTYQWNDGWGGVPTKQQIKLMKMVKVIEKKRANSTK